VKTKECMMRESEEGLNWKTSPYRKKESWQHTEVSSSLNSTCFNSSR
jgi:hypothetical protein